jgi:hypothetical protein
MPAPKKNPALVAAAIAAAARAAQVAKIAKAAKAAKTVSSIAKKPVTKVQPKQIASKDQVTKVSINNKKGDSAVQSVFRGVGKKEAVSNFKKKAKTLGIKGKVEVEKGGIPVGFFPKSNFKVKPQLKEVKGWPNKKDFQTLINNNERLKVTQRKSGVNAERAASRVAKAPKKPTIKITGK